ncbi:peptidoglycan-binding protein [Streptosporangium carneum]|uniref:peptidoglycan-binding protein n=1 Tax=Streptosporangium carneum TaxID=47481 RepID=UPI0022F33799|nr:peptidoglycan-binding protein [Streptosporangium carneum]
MIKYLAGTIVLSFGVLGFAAPPPTDRQLRPGDYAKPVERLQRRLQKLNFLPGLVNGYYGMETQAAVWAFQKSQGLMPEDKVDRKTWRALAHPRALPPLVPSGGDRRVEIDLDRQLLTVYQNQRPALISYVFTGDGPYFCRYGRSSTAITPEGDFGVAERAPLSGGDPLASMYETFSFERDSWPVLGDDAKGGVQGGAQAGVGEGTQVGVRGGALSGVEARLPVKPVRWLKEGVPVFPSARPTASTAPSAVRPPSSTRPASSVRPALSARPPSSVRPSLSARPVPSVRPVPSLTVRPTGSSTARPTVSPVVRPTASPVGRPASSAAPAAQAPAPADTSTSGCVRVPSHVAERLFQLVRVGDPVHVRHDVRDPV